MQLHLFLFQRTILVNQVFNIVDCNLTEIRRVCRNRVKGTLRYILLHRKVYKNQTLTFFYRQNTNNGFGARLYVNSDITLPICSFIYLLKIPKNYLEDFLGCY